ncbi:MAG: putative aliphatic sulfonates transport permease protein SsuC [Alphaproteobacteria bacterium MarineAlpha9_Bin3]|nr:MAG: putative aliphatic sulfonates transport permease protein SsuC [Alphaproteobacteria bacterium MarineAlpha9_Bin3]
MNYIFKYISSFIIFLIIWWLIQYLTNSPSYILPNPYEVFLSMKDNLYLLAYHSMITFFEILVGFVLGLILGMYTGILFIISKSMRKWMLPFIILTQAIPIFAIAPVLTLWVGYGIWSKIIMTILIIYFPITIAFYDGLKRIDPMIINLAKMMGANTFSMLLKIRIPYALPQLSSGLKLAAAFAPMGAVIGEWVGSSEGLGYLMLYASGRVQIDLMFSSIIILAFFTILLYNIVSYVSNYITRWDPKSHIN